MSDNSNGGSAYTVSYHPRLCHLTKWEDFNGYGFNLHAEKGKAGQYIGKVDEGSPAVFAKLRQGDRIVEVNGVNIGNENHQQVVQRIKAGGEETKLLVVDAETDLHFKEQKIVVRGDMPEVIYCKTPPTSDAVTPEGPVHMNSNHTDTEADSATSQIPSIVVVNEDEPDKEISEIDSATKVMASVVVINQDESDEEITETHTQNEETGELTEYSKEVNDTTDAAAVVTNGVEEAVETPAESAEEIKENGISEFLVSESVVNVEEAAPEPEVALPESVAEPAEALPEPDTIPEPIVDSTEPELTPEPVVAPPELTPEPVVAPLELTPEPAVEPTDLIPEPAMEPTEPIPEPIPEPVVAAPEPELPVAETKPEVVIPEPKAEAMTEPTALLETTKPDDDLDFGKISVEEMKKRIQSKKKIDNRFTQMGLREKYDLLQRL